MRCGRHAERAGFALLPVVLALALLGATAYLMSRESALGSSLVSSTQRQQRARYLAEAAMRHADWQVQGASCSGFSDVATTSFADGSYDATVTPSSGSPVTLSATGTLADGTSHTLRRENARAYQAPQTVTLQLDAVAGKDTMTDSFYSARNHGGAGYLQVNSDAGWTQNPIIQFDLSGLPAGARVLSARLELMQWDVVVPGVASVHRITRDWVEGTKNGGGTADGATWHTHDGTNAWAQPGGDFEPHPAGEQQVTAATSGQWMSWEVGGLVEDWLAGRVPNYGFLIRGDGILEEAEFASKEASGPLDAPKLSVLYACECGQVCAPGGAGSDPITLSTDSDAILGGLSFSDIDLVEYDPPTDTASLFFDGGPTTLNVDITALHVLANGHLVLAGKGNPDVTLGGVTFQAGDLVDYDPVEDTATLIFDGNALFTDPAETITAVHVLDNGHLVLATDSAAILGTVSFTDRDLVEYDVATDTASLFFDGSLTTLNVDITALHVLANGHFVLAGKGNPDVTLGGLAFQAGDLVDYDPVADTATLIFDGEALFTGSLEKIISVHVGAASGATAVGEPPQTILLVVGDATTLDPRDAGRLALMESWGFAVNVIDDGESQASFDTAATDSDVVYVTGSIGGGTLADKLTGSPTAIVNEFAGKLDNFGFASITTATLEADTFSKSDGAHYVTSPFGGAAIGVFSLSLTMPVPTGTLAPDLQALGGLSSFGTGTLPGLAVLASGAERWDGNPAPARRVHLPFGAAETSQLTADGETLMRRSIEWGAGAGDGGGGEPVDPPTGGVVYEGFAEVNPSTTYNVDVPPPAGTVEGDLLIAAIASDEDATDLAAPPGWNLIALEAHTTRATLGVWWKIAAASEPATHQFTSSRYEMKYGWMMRFSGHDPANPIHATSSFDTGSSKWPTVPSTTTTVDDTLILRIGGFDHEDITLDDPGLAGHTPITMDLGGSGLGACAGGAGYSYLPVAGASGTVDFALTGKEEYVTGTIAIAPDPY